MKSVWICDACLNYARAILGHDIEIMTIVPIIVEKCPICKVFAGCNYIHLNSIKSILEILKNPSKQGFPTLRNIGFDTDGNIVTEWSNGRIHKTFLPNEKDKFVISTALNVLSKSIYEDDALN